MQSCRRGGDRHLAGAVGVNGLVTFEVARPMRVVGLAGDVGWQRHLTESVGRAHHRFRRTREGERDFGHAVSGFRFHHGFEFLWHPESRADRESFAGAEGGQHGGVVAN